MTAPLEVERFALTAFVGEVVMARTITPFLTEAQRRGCEVQVGTDSLRSASDDPHAFGDRNAAHPRLSQRELVLFFWSGDVITDDVGIERPTRM